MLLAVDIGNTNIKLALFRLEKIIYTGRVVTNKSGNIQQYTRLLKGLLRQGKIEFAQIEQIIICSVVPKLTSVLQKALLALLGKRSLILGKDIIAPIKNLYQKPEQVGQDRLANAVAAVARFGRPVIVVDFGTALTFDVISSKGSYLGGAIVPGLEISLQALIESAALLPKITLGKPKEILGRDTVSSMQSGAIYGYAFLVEGFLQRLKKKLGKKTKVIATGGQADLMKAYCPSINRISENLTLEGLRIASENR